MVVDHFEGPEKKLELAFAMKGTLMHMGADTWQPILDLAACTILSETHSSTVEAYLLSESSLFVFENRIMIKTCGTTKLLYVLPKFIELAKKIDPKATVQSLSFSRKNYICPHLQLEPHTDFETEIEFLQKHVPGRATVMGPPSEEDGDHWCVYLSDKVNDSEKKHQVLEIMMLDLDTEIMNEYHQKTEKRPAIDRARAHYLGAEHFDDHLFFPCGYSVNAVKEHHTDYFTVHITPNEGHSYVSYETNADEAQYGPLANEVVDTYKPDRFCVALKRGEQSAAREEDWSKIQFPGYERIEYSHLDHHIHHIVFLVFAKESAVT